MTLERRRFLIVTGAMVASLVLPVLILPPVAWWARGKEIQRDEMRMESQHLAEDMAELVTAEPDNWLRDHARMSALVSESHFANAGAMPERRTVLDVRGATLFASGSSAIEIPEEVMRAPIMVRGELMGYAEIRRSLRPLLKDCFSVSLGALALGSLLLLALWQWVLRGLRHAWYDMETERARIQVTLASIGDALFTVDRDGHITYMNVEAEALSGWPSEEALGRRLDEVMRPLGSAPGEGAGALAWLEDRDGSRQSREIVNRIGNRYKVDWVVTPMMGEGLEGRVVVVRNVSAQREAEEAMRQSEARLAEAQRIAHMGSWEWRIPSGTLLWSDEIYRILGLAEGESAPNYFRFLMAIHKADRKSVNAALSSTLSHGEEAYVEFRIQRPDGNIRHIEGRGTLVRDTGGRPLRIFGSLLDVTERHQIEQALRRSADRLSILRSVDQAILRVHSAKEIADAALRQVHRLFPYIRASVYVREDRKSEYVQVLAVSGLELAIAPAGTKLLLDEPLSSIWRSLLDGKPVLRAISTGDHSEIMRLAAGNGAGFVFVAPLFWRDTLIGSLNFTIADAGEVEGETREIIMEIADMLAIALRQAMLNAEVSNYAERLERTVAERTADLMRAARSKDEFLASMSHELRTPLTAVLGLTEVLRERAYGPVNDKQDSFLKLIEESGRHLLDLINDILDLAKIEAGKLQIDQAPVSADSLVENSLNMVRTAARKKNLILTHTEDGRVHSLVVDGRRIKQALVNLLANAIKFTPEGGRVGLEVIGDRTLNEARLTVWDTGIGIDESDLPKLFNPFVQIDSTLSRQYGGTGLGLALVKRMVELHGGRVEVTSTPEIGSRFTLVLPWHESDMPSRFIPGPVEQRLYAAAPPVAVRGLHVLVVDDNAINRDLMQEFLSIQGCEVQSASGGREALGLLTSDPLPDVVLLDVRMPGMDGIETLAHMRTNPRTAGLRVVAVTAQAMDGDRERLIGHGFDDYLAKPFVLPDLMLKVRGGNGAGA